MMIVPSPGIYGNSLASSVSLLLKNISPTARQFACCQPHFLLKLKNTDTLKVKKVFEF
jgi:hypothetical protein